MDSQKVKKRHLRHAGLDPAFLYFQILLDSGLRLNDENQTFCGVDNNEFKNAYKSGDGELLPRPPLFVWGLSESGRLNTANQLKRLGRRPFFNPPVFPAVRCPVHHAVVAKPSAKKRMISEKMIVFQKLVNLFLSENLSGWQPGPNDPQTDFLLAAL